MSKMPTGEEREVKFLGSVAIDGAPVSYVVVLAAVVAALGFVPFTPMLGLGGSFPLSQSVFGLVGWLLGPIAGATASGIGRLIGVFLAPHTAGSAWPASVWGAAVGSLAAGSMVLGAKRRGWWIPLSALFIIELAQFVGRAVFVNGVGVGVAVLTTFVNWSSILLFVLPTRTLFARWIRGGKASRLPIGLFLGTWMVAGLSHLSASSVMYFMFNWPEEVWITLIPTIPVENLFRCLVGTVLGTGVILGLRAIGLVKPSEAIY